MQRTGGIRNRMLVFVPALGNNRGMNQPATPQATLIGMVAMFAVIGIVLFFRLRRLGKERPLKLEQLWVVPAIYLMVVIWLFARGMPERIGWMICAATFLAGCGLGWQRGRMMHITIDPETHILNHKASIAGMLFIVGLIAVKVAAQIGSTQLHLNVALLTQALGTLGLGLFTMQRVEMYVRARRMLEARGA